MTVEAGAATSGNGGTLTLRGGTSNSGTGGDVVIDAGDSTTKASTYEGVIHIGPNAASYVRVGKSSNKQVQTDIFGDLTVHGNLITTNDLVFVTATPATSKFRRRRWNVPSRASRAKPLD